MYYRSRYRQKDFSGGKKILIVIAAVIITVTLTIILGNHLKHKAEDSLGASTPMPDEVTVSDDDITITGAAPQVNAYPLDISALTADEAEDIADEILDLAYSGVSIKLTDSSGKPLYRSEITSELYKDDTAEPELTDLKEITDIMHEKGLRTVGCFSVNHLVADTAAEEALRYYEIALICELKSLGIDEVVLFQLKVPTDDNVYPLEYIEKIKDNAPDLTIGAAFDLSAVAEGSTELNMLLSRVDFLAVELYIDPTDISSASDAIGSQISSASVIFTKFAPRVLLAYEDDELLAGQVSALANNFLTSWQIYYDDQQ